MWMQIARTGGKMITVHVLLGPFVARTIFRPLRFSAAHAHVRHHLVANFVIVPPTYFFYSWYSWAFILERVCVCHSPFRGDSAGLELTHFSAQSRGVAHVSWLKDVPTLCTCSRGQNNLSNMESFFGPFHRAICTWLLAGSCNN